MDEEERLVNEEEPEEGDGRNYESNEEQEGDIKTGGNEPENEELLRKNQEANSENIDRLVDRLLEREGIRLKQVREAITKSQV